MYFQECYLYFYVWEKGCEYIGQTCRQSYVGLREHVLDIHNLATKPVATHLDIHILASKPAATHLDTHNLASKPVATHLDIHNLTSKPVATHLEIHNLASKHVATHFNRLGNSGSDDQNAISASPSAHADWQFQALFWLIVGW